MVTASDPGFSTANRETMTNYTNGTCKRCGSRCQGRFCQACGRDEHREQNLDEDQDDTDQLTYECCDCGHEYESHGPGQCPACGYYGARAIAEACA